MSEAELKNKECPFCNSIAVTEVVDGVPLLYCVNPDCCLHKIRIPADEWNRRPGEQVVENKLYDMTVMIRSIGVGIKKTSVILKSIESELRKIQ